MTSKFNGTNKYAVIGAKQNRTWCASVADAIDHGANLICAEDANELLIIKVVGRVRRRVPVDYFPYEDENVAKTE